MVVISATDGFLLRLVRLRRRFLGLASGWRAAPAVLAVDAPVYILAPYQNGHAGRQLPRFNGRYGAATGREGQIWQHPNLGRAYREAFYRRATSMKARNLRNSSCTSATGSCIETSIIRSTVVSTPPTIVSNSEPIRFSVP